MKTSTLTSLISGLSIMSLSLLLIVSFSVEASAKRGCANFGHSCLGGHGKRSNSDIETRLRDVDIDNDSINDAEINLDSNENQSIKNNYIPLLIRQMLASYRHPYNADLTSNDK